MAGGLCVLEAVALAAGERPTGRLRVAGPVVAAVLRGLDDGLDERRCAHLLPLALDAIGTAGDGQDDARLAWSDTFLAGTTARWRRHRVLRPRCRDRLSAVEAVARRSARRARMRRDDHAHRRLLAMAQELVGHGGRPRGWIALSS
jgi:hypothetical protein